LKKLGDIIEDSRGRAISGDHPPDPPRPARAGAILALVLLVAALAPAAWGQARLMEDRSIGWLGSALAVVMVIAGARTGHRPPGPWTEPPTDPRLASRWPWLIPALTLGILAWWSNFTGIISEPWVVLLWLCSLASLLAPYLVPDLGRPRSGNTGPLTRTRRRWPELLAVALLLGAALAFRLTSLERFPSYVHYDEASCGLLGREIIERAAAGNDFWFESFPHFWGFPAMGFFPSAAAQAVTGTNLYGHRLGNVVLGMVSLWCLWSMVRSIWGANAALVALGLAATAHTAVHWSRSGIHSGHAAWLTVICAWLTWKAVATGRLQFFILAGFALASCLLTYNAAALVPLWIALVLAVSWAVSKRFRRALSVPLSMAVLASVLFLGPMLDEVQKGDGGFLQRSSMMVWTDDPVSVQHMRTNFDGDFRRAAIAQNWRRVSRLLQTTGDSNLQYGSQKIGAVDGLTAVVFMLGLGAALAWPTHPGHWSLLLVLTLTVVLGGLLVMDGVQYSRIAGLALITGVAPALWARQVVTHAGAAFGRWAGGFAGAILAAGVILIGAENFTYTFLRHDALHWSGGGMRHLSIETAIARNIRDWGNENTTWVHGSLPTGFHDQGYRLIADARTKIRFETVDEVDPDSVPGAASATVVIPPDAPELAAALEERFPGGRWVPIEIEHHDPSDIALAYRLSLRPR
jgi:4-amino-4-deoxy-L-arabinose transferase-like glycosyltransferase